MKHLREFVTSVPEYRRTDKGNVKYKLVDMLMPASATEIISIDGKAMRVILYENGRNPDIVSGYLFHSGFTLVTDVCKEKSNEIKALPRLLDKVDISGCIVTAAAMSFQKSIFCLKTIR